MVDGQKISGSEACASAETFARGGQMDMVPLCKPNSHGRRLGDRSFDPLIT